MDIHKWIMNMRNLIMDSNNQYAIMTIHKAFMEIHNVIQGGTMAD